MLTEVGEFFIIGASQISATVLPFCFHNGLIWCVKSIKANVLKCQFIYISFYMVYIFPFKIQAKKQERKDEGEDLREVSQRAIEYI